MKKTEKRRSWKRYILPVILLAVICIGGVELFVCSFQAPDVYEAITAPVFSTVRRAGELGGQALEQLTQAAGSAMNSAALQARRAAGWVQDNLQRLSQAMQPDPEAQDEDQLLDETSVAPPPRPKAEYTVTALTEEDGQTCLTGGSRTVVYYNQTDEAWAQEPYGSDHIGGYGCGPVAMAMVVSTLTDTQMDPVQMAQHCVDHGYWARKHGSYRHIAPGVAEDFGLECVSLSQAEVQADPDSLTRYLSTGSLAVVLMGPGHFTSGGHFIVLRGVTLEGSVLVADPASPERSLTTWDLELILSELATSYNGNGPIWVISPPLLS